jgi:hypothetical protein
MSAIGGHSSGHWKSRPAAAKKILSKGQANSCHVLVTAKLRFGRPFDRFPSGAGSSDWQNRMAPHVLEQKRKGRIHGNRGEDKANAPRDLGNVWGVST